MNEDERYDALRQAFLEYTQDREGPYRISIAQLGLLHRQTKLPDTEDMVLKLMPIFRRMVGELCPIQLVIPEAINIVELIETLDVNTNYIYAAGYNLNDMKTRVLCLSSDAIAVMIRLVL
jgi:hypothetical protein